MTFGEFKTIVDRINDALNGKDVGTEREEGFSIKVTLSNGVIVQDAVWSYPDAYHSSFVELHPSDRETVYVPFANIITVEMES